MDTEGTMSGIKAHTEDDTEKLGEDLASMAKVGLLAHCICLPYSLKY